MSLLLDALNKASAQNNKNNDASSQPAHADKALDSSQKQAASLFSANRPNHRSKLPLVISTVVVLVISAGIYWWPFPNDLNSDSTSTARSVTGDIATSTSTAEQLEEIIARADQMQEEHSLALIAAEKTRAKLQLSLSDKTKTLKNTNKLLVAAKTRSKQLNAVNLKLKSELKGTKAKLKSVRQKPNDEILALKQNLTKRSESLTVNTQKLSAANTEIARLSSVVQKNDVTLSQLTRKIGENQSSTNLLKEQHNNEIATFTDKYRKLEILNASKIEEMKLAEQKIVALNEDLILQTKANNQAKKQITSLENTLKQNQLENQRLARLITNTETSLRQLKDKSNTQIKTADKNRELLSTSLAAKTDALILADKNMATLHTQIEEKDLRLGKIEAQLNKVLTEREMTDKKNVEALRLATVKQDKLNSTIEAKTAALTLADKTIATLHSQIEGKDQSLGEIKTQLSQALAAREMTDDKNSEALRLVNEKQLSLNSTIAEKNQQQAQAITKLRKIEQENKLLNSQIDSLKKQNEANKKQQLLANSNIAKIQKVQDDIFLQLKNEHEIALSQIEEYELEKQLATQARVKSLKADPRESITLKLDMNIINISN